MNFREHSRAHVTYPSRKHILQTRQAALWACGQLEPPAPGTAPQCSQSVTSTLLLVPKSMEKTFSSHFTEGKTKVLKELADPKPGCQQTRVTTVERHVSSPTAAQFQRPGSHTRTFSCEERRKYLV